MSETSSEPRHKIRMLDVSILSALACAALALAVWTGWGLWRPIAPESAATISARSGIICPASMTLVDSVRLQEEINLEINRLAADFASLPPDAKLARLTHAQQMICQFILQNPRRGIAWVQLLAVSPQAQTDTSLFSTLYQTSFDLARLDADAVRGRIQLAAPRWAELKPEEKQIMLADARTLMLTKISGFTHPLLVAQEGIKGGDELRGEFRTIVAAEWPEALSYYDFEERKVLAGAGG